MEVQIKITKEQHDYLLARLSVLSVFSVRNIKYPINPCSKEKKEIC